MKPVFLLPLLLTCCQPATTLYTDDSFPTEYPEPYTYPEPYSEPPPPTPPTTPTPITPPLQLYYKLVGSTLILDTTP